MDRIRISCNNIDELKEQPDFKLAVQLSRLLNVIRANQRQYLRINNDDDPANVRDRLELILYHGAIIFESVKTLLCYSKQLKRLNSWINNIVEVQKIQREFNNNQSFTQKYLKPIRNEILFHYDIDIIGRILEDYPLAQNAIFAEAKSERALDLAFVLADELLINLVIQNIEEESTESEKWGYFEEKLLDISNDLSNLLYDFVIELLGEHLYIEERRG